MPNNVKAVIFDMDGLMIDSERLYIQIESDMATEHGRTLTREVVARMMGQRPIDSMRIFAEDLSIPVSPVELLAERDRRLLRRMEYDLELMPGLRETLASLRGKYALAIATGATGRFLDLTLDRFNLRGDFSVLVSSDGIQNGKPHPEIYLKTIGLLQMPAECCVVLEDSANGVRAGSSAGAYSIAVPSEHTAHQDFSSAAHIASNLLDACAHILAKG
ncbi:MAG: HAD family phosphatase [Leptospirales bacterium]|nr:HAD family phosphatase [Leptospirales bacterium]